MSPCAACKGSPPIGIRPAKDADMGAATAIYAHHVLEGVVFFETKALNAADMRRRRADVVANRLPDLIATEDNSVLQRGLGEGARTPTER